MDVLRTIGTDWSCSSRILSFEVVGEDTLAEVVEALVNGITSWLGWVDAIAWCKSAFSSYISSYKAQLVRSREDHLSPSLSLSPILFVDVER